MKFIFKNQFLDHGVKSDQGISHMLMFVVPPLRNSTHNNIALFLILRKLWEGQKCNRLQISLCGAWSKQIGFSILIKKVRWKIDKYLNFVSVFKVIVVFSIQKRMRSVIQILGKDDLHWYEWLWIAINHY